MWKTTIGNTAATKTSSLVKDVFGNSANDDDWDTDADFVVRRKVASFFAIFFEAFFKFYFRILYRKRSSDGAPRASRARVGKDSSSRRLI